MFIHRALPELVGFLKPTIVPAVAAALIGGGASLLGGLMGNRSSAKQADIAYDRNVHLANTAHQR